MELRWEEGHLQAGYYRIEDANGKILIEEKKIMRNAYLCVIKVCSLGVPGRKCL